MSDSRDYRTPAWIGRPENELGKTVAVDLELLRSETLAVAITGFSVFTTGLSFALEVRTREPIRSPQRFHPIHPLEAPDGLRFGVQFADGAKATTSTCVEPGRTPSPPQLRMSGILGLGGRGFDGLMWLWPLPPPGPLAFVVEWSQQGIPLTRCEIDTRPILDAAARVEQLWADERPLRTGSTTQIAG